jgi:hypothetical protein
MDKPYCSFYYSSSPRSRRSTCGAGYSGDLCATDVDECASNPCLNNAACTESSDGGVAVDTFKCACAAGWANGYCDAGTNSRGRVCH